MTITVQEAMDRIIQRSGAQLGPKTVDTLKQGRAGTELKGIASCFLANLPVLEQTVKAGANLVITHEPIYYNHLDESDWLRNDPVYEAKLRFLQDNDLAVWRLHDMTHIAKPDMILTGMAQALGFSETIDPEQPRHFRIAPGTLRELAEHCKEKLGIKTVRFTGDPEMPCERVALRVGAPGGRAQIESFRQSDVDVVITGESAEWETCEYVRDAIGAGQRKALIILGHANSEEAGIRWVTDWIRGVVPEVPVTHLVTGDPFTFI